MAKFTTRVELHKANADDYLRLHTSMEAEGFIRTITSSDGVTYQLPTAEYNRINEMSRDKVLESAKRAADKTGKEYEILVTETEGRTWWNLKKIS